MGNEKSTISKAHSGQRAKVASIEPQQPHHAVPMQRKLSTNQAMVDLRAYPTAQKGEKPLDNDDTFSTYIKRAKYKIKSITNNGLSFHEEQSYSAPSDVANNDTYNNKENERDPFSDFIQNAKKKIRTVSRKYSSFRRG